MSHSPTPYRFPDLGALIDPDSLVLVGASERRDSIGGRALVNLIEESDFRGELYLVNPTRKEIAGRKCWPSVTALPAAPQLAVIAVPAAAVLPVLRECAAKGVRFVILFTSGFGEVDAAGLAAEEEMKAIARESGMRIYGPNSPGLSNMNRRLGFTFSPAFKLDLKSGPLGLTTQGGGLGRTLLQSSDRGTGTGLWFSAGNEVDLEISDFIHYMADLPDIRVIVAMIEGIKDGPKFIAAARHAAARGKPIVVLKIGRSDYGIKGAQSHTASITGSAEVNSAVFRQLGIVEVDDIDELADVAWLLVRRPPTGDEQMAVFSYSGGAAALMADLIGVEGLTLATFDPKTRQRLAAIMPAYAPTDNPVDTTAAILADMSIADPALQAIVDDPAVGLLFYPFPMDYGDTTTRLAEIAAGVQRRTEVPILPVWMSDRRGGGHRVFADAGIAPMPSAGKAAKAARRWVEHGRRRQQMDPAWLPLALTAPVTGPTGKTVMLAEHPAKQRLARSGIPVLPSALVHDVAAACRAAASLGYPVAAKIASAAITHKSDVGGVRLGIASDDEMVAAWDDIHRAVRAARPDAAIDGLLIEAMAPPGGIEILIGVQRDPVFGHLLTFGLGGIHVEVFREVTRRLLPLRPRDAADMIRELRFFPLLDGARGRPRLDVEAIERLLLAVSAFVSEHAATIEEMDLNPVWVGARGQGAMPLDAVIVERVPAAMS